MATIETTSLSEKQGQFDGASLARNTAFNFAGQVLPLVAGVSLIPYIVKGLGPDRFGMLGIIWVVFGYFSLMDFGLGRATTKFLAEWLTKRAEDRISEIVWSSILLQIALGILGGFLIAVLTPVLVERVLKTPSSLVPEARAAFYILAAALPVVLATSGLRAVLEGCQRFDIANLLRIPSSTLAFVIPAIAVSVGAKLPGVVLWMAISRGVFTVAHGYYCVRVLPCLKLRPVLRSRAVFPLLSFGGWVTASNVVNPILVSMDRFMIGSLVSVAMVGYYTAPFEAVTKLWVIPASLMTTVFPVSSALGLAKRGEIQSLYSRTIKYIFCAIAPPVLILVMFARPIIGIWLGPAFVAHSALPLQLLAAGVFINCFAHVPYCFLQALGRPDTAAKLFLCELVPYGLLLWRMVERNGIAGAAAAWTIRVAIEVALLLWITKRVFSISVGFRMDKKMWVGVGALGFAALGMIGTNFLLRDRLFTDVSLCVVWLVGFTSVAWRWVLDEADRASAKSVFAALWKAPRKPLERAEAD
jgi:O-antigen/teichoic acid export membrane protein